MELGIRPMKLAAAAMASRVELETALLAEFATALKVALVVERTIVR